MPDPLVETPEERLARFFNGGPFENLSKKTSRYNCIAFAVGREDQWWSDLPESFYYWPKDVERGEAVKNLIDALRTEGFEDCGSDATYDAAWEKIAVYGHEGLWTHVSKVCEGGWHWSKMGDFEDAKHKPEDATDSCGDVVTHMRRPQRSKTA